MFFIYLLVRPSACVFICLVTLDEKDGECKSVDHI